MHRDPTSLLILLLAPIAAHRLWIRKPAWMQTCAALLAILLCAPLQAEPRNFVLEMYDELGQFVATHQLRLEFGPIDARSTRTVSGVRTVDQIDPAYESLLGGSENASGSMHGPHLRLFFSRGILSTPLEIEAVMMPNHNGAFEGRWKRFGCFGGPSGTLVAWPFSSTAKH